MSMGVTLGIIFVFVGIVSGALLIMNVDKSSYFNELPDFPVVNETKMQEKVFLLCDNVVGYNNGKGEIIECKKEDCKETKKTSIVIKKEENEINVYDKDSDRLIGNIRNNVLQIRKNVLDNQNEGIYYKLHESRHIDEFLFCKSEEDMEPYNQKEMCNKEINCSFLGGKCKTKYQQYDLIEIKDIRCKNEKSCLINPNNELLDKELRIKSIKIKDYEKDKEIIKNDKIELNNLRKGFFLDVNENDYCLLINTDKEKKIRKYKETNQNQMKGETIILSGHEKFLQFIVYIPWEKKKVIKNFKISFSKRREIIPGMDELKYVKNKDFKKNTKKMRIGEKFLIILDNPVSDIPYYHYKIEKKKDDKYLISYWKNDAENFLTVGDWRRIDCSSWPFYAPLDESKRKEKLSTTILESCKR